MAFWEARVVCVLQSLISLSRNLFCFVLLNGRHYTTAALSILAPSKDHHRPS
ncbi:hypothetical protein Sjap_011134 [Stephania japonica]|uniref:Uncharacterized protein n=1 Tax=Stephania japonica TaxID=461633 RepID=A0AAP0JAH7_9MAGN